MKKNNRHKGVNTDQLLDTLHGELLDLQGDLIAVGREQLGEIQDLLGEGGREKDNLGSLWHLLLDALALVAHALQICTTSQLQVWMA